MSDVAAAGGVVVRPAVVRAVAAVAEARRAIAARHAAGGDGWAVAVLACERFDAIVRDVWAATLDDLQPPWSDVDLMILHDGRPDPAVGDVARRLLQDLFDAGLEVGQSVRSVADAVALAGTDATIASSLLDCRLLAGAAEPLRRLQARLRTALARGRRRHVERLVEARRIASPN